MKITLSRIFIAHMGLLKWWLKILYSNFLCILANLYYALADFFYDIKFQIETAHTPTPTSEWTKSGDYNRYVATSYFMLQRMVRYVNKNDVFLDVGCGKGRAPYFMRSYVKESIGVEIDEKLCKIARLNRVNIVNCDIFDFNIDNVTVFFVAGPFGAASFMKFVEKIKKSLISNPRKIIIITYGGVYPEYLQWLQKIEERGFCVYSSK